MAAAPPLRTGNLAAPPTDSALRAASHVPDDVDAPARKISDLERPTIARATAAAATPAPLASPSTMAADPPLRTGGLARPLTGSALRAASRPPDSADVPARRNSKPKRPSTTRDAATAANSAAAPPQQRHRPTEPSARSTTLLATSASATTASPVNRCPLPCQPTATQAPVAAATPAPKLSPATIVCLLPALVAMPPLGWIVSLSRRLLPGIVSTITTPGTLATAPPIMPITLAILLPALFVTSVVGALAEVTVDFLGIYLVSVLRWRAPQAIYQRYEPAHRSARRHPITNFLLGCATVVRFAILFALLALLETAKLLALGAQSLALQLQRWATPLEPLPPGAVNHLRLHDLRPSQTISRSTFKVHKRRSHKKARRRYLQPLWPMLCRILCHTFSQLQALFSLATRILRAASNTTINFARRLLPLLMALYNKIIARCPSCSLSAMQQRLNFARGGRGRSSQAAYNNLEQGTAVQTLREESPAVAESTGLPCNNSTPHATTPRPHCIPQPELLKANRETPHLLSEDERPPSPRPRFHPRVTHIRKRKRDQTPVYALAEPELQPRRPASCPSSTDYIAALTSAIDVLRKDLLLPGRFPSRTAAPFAVATKCWDAWLQHSYYFPEDNVIKWIASVSL